MSEQGAPAVHQAKEAKEDAVTEGAKEEIHHRTQTEMVAVVGEKEARMVRARRRKDGHVWFGFGMFGMIGWSVAMPMLLAIALGVWIDAQWPSRYSWTLMLLLLGIALGCLNAWYWVSRERTFIEHEIDEAKNSEQAHE